MSRDEWWWSLYLGWLEILYISSYNKKIRKKNLLQEERNQPALISYSIMPWLRTVVMSSFCVNLASLRPRWSVWASGGSKPQSLTAPDGPPGFTALLRRSEMCLHIHGLYTETTLCTCPLTLSAWDMKRFYVHILLGSINEYILLFLLLYGIKYFMATEYMYFLTSFFSLKPR